MSNMYADNDPRSRLGYGGGHSSAPGRFSASEYARFYETEPQEIGPGVRTWYARGQNFIVAVSETEPGAVLERKGQVDEYVAILQARGKGAEIEANGEHTSVEGHSIVILPPGDSRIALPHGGRVVRLITTRSTDIAAKCSNAAAYAEPHPYIPPLESWPDPPGGSRVRAYSLDVPAQEGRFGQIWRCTTFMVNVFAPVGPRPLDKLSPHHHDDFEQCSLAIEGSFYHHLRWPWTADIADWREDEHEHCATPSIVVIPPRAIHTTAAHDNPGPNVLVDIFSPPRMDFSKQPGWVLNADEYPMPEQG